MPAKRILVVGGTGAQGFAVVKALLAADPPYQIRVLSRDPEAPAVVEKFRDTGVELVKGSFMDIDSVQNALQDCYGLFLNTDSFTVKESDEMWAAIRIFEISNRIPTLRHFVWSGIDYALKRSGFNPRYGAYHVNAKGRVNEYLENQPSSKTEDGLAWTILNTAAYNEMLAGGLFMPQIQADGTRVFAFPLGSGRLPLIALDDIGTFARLIFDSRATFSGATLGAVSHFATGAEVAETTARVAGVKAIYMPVTYEQWVSVHPLRDLPFAKTDPTGPTFAQGFKMLWATFEDRLVDTFRDVDGLRTLHPGLRTLEGWMRETGYDGTPVPFLKGSIELMTELARARGPQVDISEASRR